MAYPDIKKVPPALISEFRQYGEDSDLFNIPELSKNRKCTDIPFLIFFALVVLVTTCLTGYSSIDTDFNRFLYGYDKCGDTCGINNDPIKDVNCSGKDLTQKKFMQLRYHGIKNKSAIVVRNKILANTCVEHCDAQSRIYFHRCFPKTNLPFDRDSMQLKTFFEFAQDLKSSVLCIGVMSITGFGNITIIINVTAFLIINSPVLSSALFICFRFFACFTVFSILALHLVGLLCFTAYVWYWYVNDTNETQLLYIGITSTVITFFLSIFICYFYDRYSIMIQLLTEAMIAIFRMPLLLLTSLMTLIVLLILLTAIIFLSALISTNADLVELEEDPSTHEYNISATGLACLTFLLITVLWLFAFTNGCQCMIIAGAVAANYFKRKQSLLSAAPFTSIYVLIRYHLGTVAFGSLVITMVMFARISVEFLRHHSKFKNLVRFLECCLAFLQEFVDYLTKRAYIQTAMHGKPLYQSGVRAARLLWSNLMDTISLDVVGDFIVFCALIFVMLVATAVGISISFDKSLTYFWTILIVGATAAGTITYFFLQVINVAIETMFLCFCEDKLMNDGKDREYFMSPELLAIVNKAKEAAKQREE